MKKIILYSLVLCGALWGISTTASAKKSSRWVLAKTQEVVAQPGEYEIQVGDTVVISRNQRYYMTGDTITSWVYNVCAIVNKVGGRRFPNGVLLRDINSWVSPEALMLIGPVEGRQLKPQPQPEPEPEPVVPAAPVIVEEPKPEPIVEPTPEPVAELKPEPVAEPASQELSKMEPKPETVAEFVARKDAVSRISIGVRGGVTSLLQDAGDAKCQLGWDAMLDVQYAYYGVTQQEHKVGLLVGIGAGYTRAGMSLDALNDQFSASTSDGDIQYTVSAENLVEKHGWVTVEVPVMFSLVTRGRFFMNIGPRVQIPVYSHYTMRYDNPNIDAYFVKERVHVPNELITGTTDAGEAKGKLAVAKYNLLAGLELGYEWNLKNGDALGLGAFADYNVYTFYKSGEEAQRVIDIAAPSDEVQPAQVNFHSLNDVYGQKRLFLDCGLKLTYHFVVGKSALK